VQFRELPGKINLLVAVYAEGDEDVDSESRARNAKALDRVQEYFGDAPFPAYTVAGSNCFSRVKAMNITSARNTIRAAHSAFLLDGATNAHSPDSHHYSALFNYAHHMAHSWVPKRVWGVGYRPFNWELTPVIETIWFK